MFFGATGQTLTDHRGTTFWLDAGATALDLAYTGDEDQWADRDLLRTPADLDRWLRGRVPASATLAPASAADLALAKQLRGAILRSAWRRVDGVAALPADAAVLNDVASRPGPAPRLAVTAAGQGFAWAPGARVADLLPALAAEAIEIVCSADDRLRRCAGEHCGLVFLDTSRSGGRRWCAMQRCGNRHKVRAHRGRQAAQPDES